MEILTASHLTKQYGQGPNLVKALDDVSISIHQGEFVAIIGTSGSGKSTLLNMLGGLDRPTSGSVKVDRFELGKLKDEDLTVFRRQRIGFIFQNYHLIPTYTVIQNVIMPLLMRGYEHEEAQEMCMDTIEMLGLKERINHKPNELSGGQKQRVAIARALVGEPAILLADEPTGALDSKSGKEVLKLFRKLNDMGNTIVMITHDLEVAKAAKRVVKIVDGEIFAVEN